MTMPAFLIGIFAGAVVDMSNRKKLMLITDVLLSLLFFSYAVFTGNYWVILAIAFISASVAQFFTPAEAATIPLIVKSYELEHSNALFLFTQLGSVMLGYAIAGPVIQLFGGIENGGAHAAFMLGGILTAIGFFLRLSLKTIETVHPDIIKHQIIVKTLILTREVLTETKQNIKISLPISLLTLMEFNIGMLAILFIDYVKKYLEVPATSTSYFLILPLIAGLGIGLAFLSFTQKWWSRGRSIFLSSVAFGLVILSLGLSAQVLGGQPAGALFLRILTIIGAGIIGVSAVFIAVHSRTLLQENTPKTMLGRVFSLVTVSASAITPIPVLAVALITDKLEVTQVLILLGLVLTLVAFGLGPILYKHIE